MKRKYTTRTDAESNWCGYPESWKYQHFPGYVKKAKRRRKAIEKSWNTTKDRQTTKKEIQENLS